MPCVIGGLDPAGGHCIAPTSPMPPVSRKATDDNLRVGGIAGGTNGNRGKGDEFIIAHAGINRARDADVFQLNHDAA
jgi:hypothetical protein